MENRVLLIGDIVRLGDLKTIASGAKVYDFTVRTWSTDTNGRQYFEYHPVTVWGDAVDKARPALQLNRVVRIDGVLSHQRWEDNFGQKRSKTIVRALLVKPLSLVVPPLPESEKAKFSETKTLQLREAPS